MSVTLFLFLLVPVNYGSIALLLVLNDDSFALLVPCDKEKEPIPRGAMV